MALQESIAQTVRRSRRSPKSVAALEHPNAVAPPLPPALESLFGLISQPVLSLETSPVSWMTLRETSILLGDVLDLLEDDPSILAAADALYGAALALQDAKRKQHTCANMTARLVKARADAIHRTLVAFRESLGRAKSNVRARARRLAW